MNVSEYIFSFLKGKGVNTAFVITGGQAMYLNDALYRTPEIKPIFTHHEQTAGMSADAYSRITGKLGLAVVTAGPGAMNIVNGLVGGFMDSAPMMVISGQSNYNSVKYMDESGIRQYGVQGINTRIIVEKVAKYFVTVDDPSKIRDYMEKAYYTAFEGRPGPVWIEVPLDVQRMETPERLLQGYTPKQSGASVAERKENCKAIIKDLLKAKRSLIVAGQGVRLAGVQSEFMRLVERLHVPVITTRLGIDLINSDHELYVGRPGNYGERSANIAAQNADYMLVLGSRLSTPSVGHDLKQFGKNAKIVYVEIDERELDKPGPNIAVKIWDDVGKFIPQLLAEAVKCDMPVRSDWIAKCRNWKHKYPVVLPEYKDENPSNSYWFMEKLSEACDNRAMVLIDTGSCFHVACQVWKIKQGQRFLTTGGLSSMGYWVAVLGACAANAYQNTIVVTGDGSLQMNIQEFATIKHLSAPIKVFVLNNNGYLLIRHTQHTFMEDRFFGESEKTGVLIPDTLKIAEAYGIKGVRIESPDELEDKIAEVLTYDGPVVCEVMTPEWQLLIPRVSSDKLPDGTLVSRNFEDMFPFLPPEEMKANMITEEDE
ncbi:MAG: thiamine pyrophosphate-binding protein [Clostridiales bacterium]|jgi:acetolactate synthase-1/2/3 large subunit|nr:thiamine pyrophosphate-binding protein [Clostridiales bacterium]